MEKEEILAAYLTPSISDMTANRDDSIEYNGTTYKIYTKAEFDELKDLYIEHLKQDIESEVSDLLKTNHYPDYIGNKLLTVDYDAIKEEVDQWDLTDIVNCKDCLNDHFMYNNINYLIFEQ